MGLEMVSWARRYQGQCWALRPLGHQGYRLCSYNKDPPLHSSYTLVVPMVRVLPVVLRLTVSLGCCK